MHSNLTYHILTEYRKKLEATPKRPVVMEFVPLAKFAQGYGLNEAQLRKGLNALYKESRIRVGDTINDKYIEILQ